MPAHPEIGPEWPATPRFHPEFGYLCPSLRVRRWIRTATVCMATGVVIGATTIVAHTYQASEHDQESALFLVGSVEQAPSASAIEILHATSIDSAIVSTPQAQSSCEDPTAYFVNSACSSGTIRNRHTARPVNRVATIVIGHASTTPTPTTAEVGSATVGVQKHSEIRTAEASTIAIIERPPMVPKPKATRRTGHMWPADNTGMTAYGTGHHNQRNPFEEFALWPPSRVGRSHFW